MPSILLSRSVAGIIHEHVGQSGQGNGRHAAGFPIQCQPGVLPINHRRNRVTSHQAMSRPCHTFAEPGGHRRTQEDTTAGEIAYRRTLEEPAGHQRTSQSRAAGFRGIGQLRGPVAVG